MTDAEILDRLTVLLREAREAKNGTARDFDGEELFGFVLDHHDYMAMHCLLNLERVGYDLAAQQIQAERLGLAGGEGMSDLVELREDALKIWDKARATLESGDRSDLARLQIEEAFELYEEKLREAAAALSRAEARIAELEGPLSAAFEACNAHEARASRAEAERDEMAKAGDALLTVVSAACGRGDYWHERRAMSEALKAWRLSSDHALENKE